MSTPDDTFLQRRRGFSVVQGALAPSSAPRTPTRSVRHAWTAPASGSARARVAVIADCCWQCRTKVRAVAGVMVAPDASPDGSGFIPFSDIADQLADAVDARTLAARGIGELRHRDSPGVEGGYVSNGCHECDALLGRFQLEDLLHEHIQNGGTYAQLDSGIAVDLPLGVPQRRTALG